MKSAKARKFTHKMKSVIVYQLKENKMECQRELHKTLVASECVDETNLNEQIERITSKPIGQQAKNSQRRNMMASTIHK